MSGKWAYKEENKKTKTIILIIAITIFATTWFLAGMIEGQKQNNSKLYQQGYEQGYSKCKEQNATEILLGQYYSSCKNVVTCIANEEKCIKEGKTIEWFKKQIEICLTR